jgi:tetratricopeptide (TPR) repeat protein
MLLSRLAESYRRLGRYQEAIDTCRILLEGNPHATHALRAYITLTCAYSALGREKDARKAVAQILKTMPEFTLEDQIKADSFIGLSMLDWFLVNEADKILFDQALDQARHQ